MADSKTQGLLGSLGLDVDPTEAGQRKIREANAQAQGRAGSRFAAANAAGRAAGQRSSGLVGGLGAALGGLISGEGGRGLGEFGRDFARGAEDTKRRQAAEALGITPEMLLTRQRVLSRVSALTGNATGDSIDDQIKLAKEIVKIANEEGDAQTVLSTLKRITQLEAQKLEFEKMEGANQDAARDRQYQQETDSTGRTVFLHGDDEDGPTSKAVAVEDEEGNITWNVLRPDGTEVTGIDPIRIKFADQIKKAEPTRLADTPSGQMLLALKLNGLTGQQPMKKREQLEAMSEQAGIVSDMTNSLMSMYNPAVAFSESSKMASGADRAISVVETISSLFDRSKSPDTTVRYDGKKVPVAEQYRRATSTNLYTKMLAEEGKTIRDVLPEHIQADSEEAQLFIANVMQLAYLDARLQEPSNRGLSDNDVVNALKRIGANSPNPSVFARRQLTTMNRLRSKVDHLGIELEGTEDVTKEKLIAHLYTDENKQRVYDALDSASAQLEEFLAGGYSRSVELPEGAGAPPTTGEVDYSNMSDEELAAAIAELEAQEG